VRVVGLFDGTRDVYNEGISEGGIEVAAIGLFDGSDVISNNFEGDADSIGFEETLSS